LKTFRDVRFFKARTLSKKPSPSIKRHPEKLNLGEKRLVEILYALSERLTSAVVGLSTKAQADIKFGNIDEGLDQQKEILSLGALVSKTQEKIND